MYFSEEALRHLHEDLTQIQAAHDEVMLAYVHRNWKNPKSNEYAAHGFSRRLKILVRCINNVFAIMPPDSEGPSDREANTDATINIQAFVFNVHGCLDNLAWIIVLEKNVMNSDGKPLKNSQIGLSKRYPKVRNKLSREFLEHLDSLADWMNYQENFRHALAHRIPLYVPPYTIRPADREKYEEYEHLMGRAVRNLNFVEHKRLQTEQDKLGKFTPMMSHSFEEKSRPVVFHPQMIVDFNTVVDLARRVLSET